MKFTFAHNNLNVLNLEQSLDFYKMALQLTEARRHEASDGSFILVFLSDGQMPHQQTRDRQEPYNLGDNELHLALMVDDFAGAHTVHEKMGCICYENKAMGIYFINDPDELLDRNCSQKMMWEVDDTPTVTVVGTLLNPYENTGWSIDCLRITSFKSGQ